MVLLTMKVDQFQSQKQLEENLILQLQNNIYNI
jgi:hypothetical protein